ncbi:nitroreductase family protein [Hylemonella gracilis]|uniref:Nitroreductase n=1 Tax=Hylemonella gracilis ATCC 19624 TaxID=887062 RepID=F3KR30_9BURK|nr:nitroreductase family protein [Hylemonella gracilis]EGI77731.1 nitroreductase [Hylemonella gracilis ATCC 19624]
MSDHDSIPGVEQLLAERYGAKSGPAYRAIDNAITRHILNHRSVRAFDEARALPPDALSTLVAAAQSASSSSNLQVWSVVAVQDPEHKARLSVAERNRRFVRQAPLFLVWLADYARAKLLAERRGVAIDGADYVESLVLASVDTALAAQNAALAAQSLGLGVVYVGGLRSHVRAIAADLKLPPGVFPVVGMAVGYPAQTLSTHIRPRLPQAAVLHHEHYDSSQQGQEAQRQAAETYDHALDAFWKKQGIDHPLWTRHIADRLTIDPQDERWQLGDILRELGFPLRDHPPADPKALAPQPASAERER